MKFQVGQRVRVYDGGSNRCGVVSERPENDLTDDAIWVQFDTPFFGKLAQSCSPQQCRRLIKKPKRRVWLNWNDIEAGDPTVCWSWERTTNEFVEFVEVKK